MTVIDANVLLYAYNADAPQQSTAALSEKNKKRKRREEPFVRFELSMCRPLIQTVQARPANSSIVVSGAASRAGSARNQKISRIKV